MNVIYVLCRKLPFVVVMKGYLLLVSVKHYQCRLLKNVLNNCYCVDF